MTKKLYIGNFKFNTSEDELKTLFSKFGKVSSVNVIRDKETDQPKGYAFVNMVHGGDEAIKELNKKVYRGRTLSVNAAKEDNVRF